MTKNALLLSATLCVAAFVPGWCSAQDFSRFDPSTVTDDSAVVLPTENQSTTQNSAGSDSYGVRNCLVIFGLGLTFCLGMAITATTIQQNRPTTPQPTQFLAS